ncbi:MAG: hypothetical protein ABR529_12335 [Actinomycetota bacterium]
MSGEAWHGILTAALVANAALGLGYRIFRLAGGGPVADVVGQAILAALLLGLALAGAAGAGWSRALALGYGLLFGIVVMPLWVLAVLIPMRPRAVDVGFTALYWALLAVIVVAVVAA